MDAGDARAAAMGGAGLAWHAVGVCILGVG